jgi:hypothetical protein
MRTNTYALSLFSLSVSLSLCLSVSRVSLSLSLSLSIYLSLYLYLFISISISILKGLLFSSPSASTTFSAVINCTGMGARSLNSGGSTTGGAGDAVSSSDTGGSRSGGGGGGGGSCGGSESDEHSTSTHNELIPIRGQTLKVLQPAVRQFVVDLSGDEADGLYGLTYILPRNDAAGTVVCGGTHEDLDGAAPSSSFSEVNEDTLRHIRRRCDALCPSLAAVSPANDVAWAGARPGRAQVRVERDRRVGESAESGHQGMLLNISVYIQSMFSVKVSLN